MKLEGKSQPLLQILLIASIISTSIHYTDNFLFIEHYPQPDWIAAPSIYISWAILTTVGIVGYWSYKNGKFWFAYACFSIYSLTGLTSLGHYFFGDMLQFSIKMHFFIWTDGVAGLAILGFTLWSGLILREWSREP